MDLLGQQYAGPRIYALFTCLATAELLKAQAAGAVMWGSPLQQARLSACAAVACDLLACCEAAAEALYHAIPQGLLCKTLLCLLSCLTNNQTTAIQGCC